MRADIIAIIAGPVVAVMVGILINWLRERKQRRLYILRTLVQNLDLPIDINFVGVLNLIRIEFPSSEQVKSSHEAYMKALREDFSDYGKQRILLENLIYEISKRIYRFNIFSGKDENLKSAISSSKGMSKKIEKDNFKTEQLRDLQIKVFSGRKELRIQRTEKDEKKAYPASPNVESGKVD